MAHHFSKSGHGSDLQAPVDFAHSAQLGNLAEIDHHLGALDAIFQPVESVQAAGHHPGVRTVLVQQTQRVVNSGRLKELEGRHDIAYDRHIRSPYMWAVRPSSIGRPASSEARIVSANTGARRKTSSPRASESAFKIAMQPAPTGGSPIPRAPTGVSGSGIPTACHAIFSGASKIVGGLVWWNRLATGRP